MNYYLKNVEERYEKNTIFNAIRMRMPGGFCWVKRSDMIDTLCRLTDKGYKKSNQKMWKYLKEISNIHYIYGHRWGGNIEKHLYESALKYFKINENEMEIIAERNGGGAISSGSQC